MNRTAKILTPVFLFLLFLLLPPIDAENTTVRNVTVVTTDKPYLRTLNGEVKSGLAYPNQQTIELAVRLPRIQVYATCVHELWHIENGRSHKGMPITAQEGLQFRPECFLF